jgi:hypothetical protein
MDIISKSEYGKHDRIAGRRDGFCHHHWKGGKPCQKINATTTNTQTSLKVVVGENPTKNDNSVTTKSSQDFPKQCPLEII